MIVSNKVKESLKFTTQCPQCGVSWVELDDSLHQYGTGNFIIATHIIRNCRICRMRFNDECERLGIND